MKKYFIQNDYTGYTANIYYEAYEDEPIEIFGKIAIDKGSVKGVLDTIRGTSVNLSLEASLDLTFDDLSDANEGTFTLELLKDSELVFKGFLKPDGVTQSFVRDIWYVDLDFIDGLGALKDLSFVKFDGTNFTGLKSCYDVIKGCLDRTGLDMNINSFINIEYVGYTGGNILKDVYVNAERFYKIDDDTIMTCEEVLNSILNLFSACITQQDAQWWLYRPNDLENDVIFINNSDNSIFDKELYILVGSQIDGFNIHHCSGNQSIQNYGAISAYRINYKYGYISGLIENANLKYNISHVLNGWTVLNSTNLIFNDETLKGITFNDAPIYSPIALKTNIYAAVLGDVFTFKMDAETYKADGTYGGKIFRIKIKCGTYYLKYIPRSTSTPISDAVNSEWVTSDSYFSLSLFGKIKAEIEIPPIPISDNLTLEIEGFEPWLTTGGYSILNSINLIPKSNSDGKIGEFHTVSRTVSPSSIIKDNQEVYNGDSIGIIYNGAVFKSNKTTLTTEWTRTGKVETKRILQISAEDDMRIQQKTTKLFYGSFHGYIPYLSIVEINNIIGKFMFIDYSYDTDKNITTGKLQQFYTDELTDLQYLLTYDYGNTVKPSIVS